MFFKCDETGFKFDLFPSKPLILSWNLSLNPFVGSTIKELQATFYGRCPRKKKNFHSLAVGLYLSWDSWPCGEGELWCLRYEFDHGKFFFLFSFFLLLLFYFSFLSPFPWLFVHWFLTFAHFLNFVRLSQTRIFSTSLHIFITVISLQK